MKLTNLEKYGFSYLGKVNSSSKIMKTNKVLDINTYVLYLAPASLSGHNVCAKATKECIAGCLNTSGRSKMDESFKVINRSRIAKTKFMFSNRSEFNAMLFADIEKFKKRSENQDKEFSARLNGTSDISPKLYKHNGKMILEAFPDVQFYDYTKILNRVELTKQHKNYDLTFSYTGYNWNECETALKNNVRVAVIFNVERDKALPKTYKGVTVIDGDTYDYRPMDAKNVIVGLRWKSIRNKETGNQIKISPFVVQPSNTDCKY